MLKMRFILVFVLLVERSLAVILYLNETEYNRMPPLFELDDYQSCLLQEGGTYCVVDVDLFGKSDLLHMIREYSEYTAKHFNHTQIHRGICVTKTCERFIKNQSLITREGLESTLGACLNESLWREYEIHGRVADVNYCKREGEVDVLDSSDVVMLVVYLVLIVLNVIGSFYDVLNFENGDKGGNPYLLAFSVRRNWNKLVAPSGGRSDPRLDRFKLFHGLRAMTMICVFFSHTSLIMNHSYVRNPLYIERAHDELAKQILFNGSLVTHTFFVMSSFLLAFNFLLHAEKYPISWVQFPKGVLLRWLRLTPVYALVLATVATLMRRAGSGPLWEHVVVSEARACRQYWWAHLLYFNNYVWGSALCLPQTWYLAADTQLFCLGLLVCVTCRTPRARKVALGIMFTVALILPALYTYFLDLDAVVIQAPESCRSLYAHERTFRTVYVQGHTNMSTYTLGLAGGFLAYHLSQDGKGIKVRAIHRWLMWLCFPGGLAVILSGGIFYVDGSPPSLPLKLIYASTYKPIFQLLIVYFIIGCVFKFETVYRGIVEWRGFTWLGRVSYSGFFVHTLFQRGLIGSYPEPVHMSDYYIMMLLAGTIFVSFLAAAILWVCVESPAAEITKAALMGRTRNDEEKQGETVASKI